MAAATASDMLQPSTSPDVNSVNATAKTPLFQSSTQFRNWRFSVEQLKSIRASLNQAAIDAIRNTFEYDLVCKWPSWRRRGSRAHQLREMKLISLCLAWFVFRCSLSRRQRGAPSRQAIYLQNFSTMWSFSFPGGSRGHRNNLLEAILPQEHRDGLAS